MTKDGNRKLIRMEKRMGRGGQQIMDQDVGDQAEERERKEEPVRMRSQLKGKIQENVRQGGGADQQAEEQQNRG